jgi:SAM-dependent methyltransferase
MTEQALYLQTKQEEYAVGLRSQGEPPVPPIELMEYGEPADRHLATGKQNVAEMLSALKESGFRWKRCKRVLEFGCSNGKLVRWLEPFAAGREIWGVDVQADKVMWAMENLSPPFRFATTTTVPHMPFPDGHFGLIFAGSVFTHLGELHVAWLSELTRLLAPGGFLYVTLHDETAIKAASEDPSHARFTAQIEDSSFSGALKSGSFGFVSMAPYGQAMLSQVMMSRAYARHIAQPLELVDTFPRAYAGFQTGYVFSASRKPE